MFFWAHPNTPPPGVGPGKLRFRVWVSSQGGREGWGGALTKLMFSRVFQASSSGWFSPFEPA